MGVYMFVCVRVCDREREIQSTERECVHICVRESYQAPSSLVKKQGNLHVSCVVVVLLELSVGLFSQPSLKFACLSFRVGI